MRVLLGLFIFIVVLVFYILGAFFNKTIIPLALVGYELRASLAIYHLLIIYPIFSLARDWSKRVTWPNILQLRLGNIREYSPILKIARFVKKIWRIIKTIAPIWGENMLGYICPWTWSVPRSSQFPRASLSENCSLLGTDNVRGQISEHIFAPNGNYCLYIQTRAHGIIVKYI